MICPETLWLIWLRSACEWLNLPQPTPAEQQLLIQKLASKENRKASLSCVDELKKIRLEATPHQTAPVIRKMLTEVAAMSDAPA